MLSEFWSAPETYISLLTLTSLEIVLGIDNIIFISILTGALPQSEQARGRRIGLIGALVSRLLLLAAMSWIAGLTTPLFTLFGTNFSGKSIILLIGGLFLIYKSTHEIHGKIEGSEESVANSTRVKKTFAAVIAQILIIDVVFSIDSVITAVGMSQNLSIMVAANVIALIVMLAAAGSISRFVDAHPSLKMLALSFLMMIGLVLVADGCGFHIPKGYVYFAMAFSVLVEFLNIKTGSRKKQ